MPSYHIKLKARTEIAHHTLGYIFDKPENLLFQAGQFVGFNLLNVDDLPAKNRIRSLSLASAPDDKELLIITRQRESVFKTTLSQLVLGSELKINGAFGAFTLHNDPHVPAVFLTGGIGIAPVRSMVLQAAKHNSSQKIWLFYSNRRPEDSAFLTELMALEQENPNYRCIATMTQMATSVMNWSGETGYINQPMLSRYIPDLTQPIYYLVGPASMVKAMRELLTHAGIKADQIRTEEFSGY